MKRLSALLCDILFNPKGGAVLDPKLDILDAFQTNPLEGGNSFSLPHRLKRLIWGVVWALGASWTPNAFNGWRRFLLLLFGARIARTANIHASVSVWYPPNLVMEDYATLGPRVRCYNMAEIRLESYALISQGAHLCAGTHDVDSQTFQLSARPIRIRGRAWVAAEAFVGPGVTIGEGAVLGARGVTIKDLAPWQIYAGNPAVLRRARKRSADGESA